MGSEIGNIGAETLLQWKISTLCPVGRWCKQCNRAGSATGEQWRCWPCHARVTAASATFALVRMANGAEVGRESWSVSLRFAFLPEIPAELVVWNPMGISIGFLQGAPYHLYK